VLSVKNWRKMAAWLIDLIWTIKELIIAIALPMLNNSKKGDTQHSFIKENNWVL
jgi:hypothetical protein